MDLKSILKNVGGGLISALVPGGPAIVGMINGFLPDDKKLPESATGTQAANAIQALPPDQQAIVLNKQYDVEIEEIRGFTDRFKAMADVDKSGHTTRPAIAMMMACCVTFTVVVVIGIFAYAISQSDSDMIDSITGGWPFVVGVLTVPSALLRSYFAMRTKEKQQKYEAATGAAAPLGLLSALANRLK